MAAVQSVRSFKETLLEFANRSHACDLEIQIWSGMYDALVDDDNEIREVAAEIVSYSMSNEKAASTIVPGNPLSSAAAMDQLVHHAQTRFADSQSWLFEGLARVMGLALPNQLRLHSVAENDREQYLYSFLQPPSDLLETAIRQDTSLFIEEKQNLFRDEAREFERWCRILCELPANTTSTLDHAPLLRWAVDGVEALVGTARQELCGPLEWTSKPEVFGLAIRILSITKVVLNLAFRHSAHSQVSELRSSLEKMSTGRVADHVHPLWHTRLVDMLAQLQDPYDKQSSSC